MGAIHRASSKLISGICDTSPVYHCFVSGKVLKIFSQYLTASEPGPQGVFEFCATVQKDVPGVHVYLQILVYEGWDYCMS